MEKSFDDWLLMGLVSLRSRLQEVATLVAHWVSTEARMDVSAGRRMAGRRARIKRYS